MTDADDLFQTALTMLGTFRGGVGALGGGIQQLSQLTAEWSALKSTLNERIFPRLGSSVRLATRTIISTIDGGLHAIQVSDHVGLQQPAQFRTIWTTQINAQLADLEALLRDPPPELLPRAVPTPPPLHDEDARADDLKKAIALLEKGAIEAERRSTDLRSAASHVQWAGIIVAMFAAVVPFAWVPTGSGWSLVAAWGGRLLTVVVLLAAAIQMLKMAQDYQVKAMTSARERSSLQVLGAAAYIDSKKDHGAALIELVKQLSAAVAPATESGALVLPEGLLKQLPDLISSFMKK